MNVSTPNSLLMRAILETFGCEVRVVSNRTRDVIVTFHEDVIGTIENDVVYLHKRETKIKDAFEGQGFEVREYVKGVTHHSTN